MTPLVLFASGAYDIDPFNSPYLRPFVLPFLLGRGTIFYGDTPRMELRQSGWSRMGADNRGVVVLWREIAAQLCGWEKDVNKGSPYD
jgi:hypothetical protein